MPKSNADTSLRIEKRQDGSMVLRNSLQQTDPKTATGSLEWPAKHEFSQEWLLENSAVVDMDSNEIRLTFANGSATYKIRRDWMEQEVTLDDKEMAKILDKNVGDRHTFRLSTGYWGELVESEVHSPHAVDPKIYETRQAHDEGKAGHEGLSGECTACNKVRASLAKERAGNG